MISNSLFKTRKYAVLTALLCLSLTRISDTSAETTGICNTSIETTGFMNTLPFYCTETDNNIIPGKLTIPLVQKQGDDETLYTVVLTLNAENRYDVVANDPVPSSTETGFDEGFPEDIAPQLEKVLNNTVDHDKIPGAIILVSYQGKVWRGVAGQARINDIPQVFSNKFRIASLTKVFVSSIVLALVADGKLSLDNTMEDWFHSESWYPKMPNGNKIKVRDLLRHQSGLYDYLSSPSIINSVMETPLRIFLPQELLAVAFASGSEFEPRTAYKYSNTNYILAGLLIEKISGQSVAENIRSLILEPTKMFNTLFPNEAAIPYYYSYGYNYSGQNISPINVTFLEPSVLWAAGAMISNSIDLENFIRLQAIGKLAPDQEFPPELQQERFTFFKNSDSGLENSDSGLENSKSKLESYNGCQEEWSKETPLAGMGIFCYYGYLGHNGLVPGYSTSSFYNPTKDIGITINLNMSFSWIDAGQIFLKIVNIFHEKDSSPRRKFLADGKLPDGRTLSQAILGIQVDELERKKVRFY